MCLDESTGIVKQMGEQQPFGSNASFNVFDKSSRNLYCVHENPGSPGLVSRWQFNENEMKFEKKQVNSSFNILRS